MPFTLVSIISALALFAGMLALMEAGARVGRRSLARDPEGARSGTGATDGAVFALLGLLIAFTFSGALQRFDERRALIVAESNALGTAYLRLHVLPAPARAELEQGMREYLDARLSVYRAPEDESAVRAALARANELQGELWSRAVTACRADGQSATMLVLPALNEVFDVASERNAAVEEHPPRLVFGLLVAMALACALLAGLAMARSKATQWTHRLAFAGVVSLTVYAIRDLEYPRQGLVRVDHFDHVLVELRASMK